MEAGVEESEGFLPLEGSTHCERINGEEKRPLGNKGTLLAFPLTYLGPCELTEILGLILHPPRPEGNLGPPLAVLTPKLCPSPHPQGLVQLPRS